LPDPEKAYDSEPIIHAIWEQFEQVLRRARRVFILGHSLSDKALVESLKRNIDPLSRLAAGILARDGNPDQIDPSADPMENMVRTSLPSAAVIPVRFASELLISIREIETWDERLRLHLEGWTG